MPNQKKVMTEFSLMEVSGVRKPAQKPALADIMKDEDMGNLAEMTDEELLKEDELEDFSLEALEKSMAQLATSVEGGHQHGICVTRNHDGTPHLYLSYAGDERDDQHSHEIVYVDGKMTITENFGHSHDVAEEELRQAILSTLMKSDMVFPEEAEIADLLKLWDQSGDDTLEKDAEMPDQDPKAAEKLAAAEAALAKAEADLADAEALAKMTDAEKTFMDKMSDDEAKKKFKGMSKMERVKMMQKSDEENPVVYKADDGTEFRKSDDPRMVEFAKRDDAREKEMAEMRKSRENDEFRKTAENDYAHIAGDVETRMALARAIEKSDEDDEMKDKMRASMKAKSTKASADMKENGKGGYSKGDAPGESGAIMKRDEAADELDRLAAEVAKAHPDMSDVDAYDKACIDNPEVYKAAITGAL